MASKYKQRTDRGRHGPGISQDERDSVSEETKALINKGNNFDLSDEVIQLNRFRNLEAQQKASRTTSVAVKNGFTDDHDDEVLTTTIQDKLRENPANENRLIFDRLGWKKPNNHHHYGGKSAAQHQAMRAVRNARQFKNRPNRVVKNFLTDMPPPLTANVLRRHNQTLGNFTVRRRNGPGSMYSMSTSASVKPSFFRHSLKKSLDPEIQQLIRNMLNDGEPAVMQCSQGRTLVDHSLLAHYKLKSDWTTVPTYVRFAMND